MVPPELLRLTFPDLGAFEREIAANIRYGRLFVSEVVNAPVLTDGEIVLVHPVSGRELRLPAQVVMVNDSGPMRGTGIALRKFGPPEVEAVEAFAREARAQPDAEPRSRSNTPEPRPRAQTPEPRPRAQTPEPRPRVQTPEPRTSQLPEPRTRVQTPAPRARAATPVPMPLTLSDRPRRGTPSPHEAVTVRPATGSIAMGTVPPTAPENDWSDLHTSDFAHQPKRSEVPAAWSAPAPAAESAPAERAAIPPAPARASQAEDDWSDVAAEAATPKLAPAEDDRLDVAAEGATPKPATAEDDWSDVAAAATTASATEAVRAPAAPAASVPPPPPPIATADDRATVAPATENEPAKIADDDWSDVAASIEQPVDAAADSCETEAADGADGFDEDADFEPQTGAGNRPTELQSDNRQERLRTLNVVEQLKIARRGELSDRVVIERLYGKQVWEALLQNPRITLPEVARIARKGTVPKPLIEQIVENNQWIREPNVRRALLSNPKLTAEGILKLLKMMPKHELKVMEKATAFPMTVRDVARKLLREGAQ